MVIRVCTEGTLHCSFPLTLMFCFALRVFVPETENLNTHTQEEKKKKRKSGDLLSKGSFQI